MKTLQRLSLLASVLSSLLGFTMIVHAAAPSTPEEMGIENGHVLNEKALTLPSGRGSARVVIRESDARLGLPYVIEVHPQCDDASINTARPLSDKVPDSKAVCDVKPASIKLSSGGKQISVMVREPDVEGFNKRSREVSGEELQQLSPACKNRGQELLIDISKFCQ